MIDCGGGPGYGMDWVANNGVGLATIKVAPLANHSDPNITGCRGITNCSEVLSQPAFGGHSCACGTPPNSTAAAAAAAAAAAKFLHPLAA